MRTSHGLAALARLSHGEPRYFCKTEVPAPASRPTTRTAAIRARDGGPAGPLAAGSLTARDVATPSTVPGRRPGRHCGSWRPVLLAMAGNCGGLAPAPPGGP